MNEGHGDPPADVRAFLPRPGEPVEQYAERLRALHRDLTLVLEAVERGLATAGRTEEQRASEPDAAGEPPRWRRTGDERPAAERERRRTDDDAPAGSVEVREEEPEEPADPWEDGPVEIHPVQPEVPVEGSDDSAPRPRRAPAVPRIEVLPAPSGERRRADAEDRREEEPVGAAATAPDPAWAETPAPKVGPVAEVAGPAPGDEPAADVPEAGERPRAVPRPPRFPTRPSEAATPAREPEWVEGTGDFAVAEFPSQPADAPPVPAPSRGGLAALPPVVVGAMVAGWVTVVVLLVALLL